MMKIMRWSIHCRRKFSAIKQIAFTSLLHPFNNEQILFEYSLPLLGVGFQQIVKRWIEMAFLWIIDFHMLYRPIEAHRFQQNGIEMISVGTHKDIRVHSDILGALVPLGAQVFKVGKNLSIIAFELLVNMSSLS